jgi:hypothetical protein
MRCHADRVARVEFDDALAPSIARLLDLLANSPAAGLAVDGPDTSRQSAFSSRGFELYPTGRRTTVFHDPESDCFLKILHPRPRGVRAWAGSLLTDRAREIHALSEWLVERDVPVPRVRAFGTIRQGWKPFYAVERARGQSLYDLAIRERRAIPATLYRTVVDAVARLHELGHWLGDAHLSHIFVHEGQVSAFIDIDGMRRNGVPRLTNLAKDLAGLNHPGLALEKVDRASLLGHYAGRMNLGDTRAFARLVRRHSRRRWRSWRPDPGTPAPGP